MDFYARSSSYGLNDGMSLSTWEYLEDMNAYCEYHCDCKHTKANEMEYREKYYNKGLSYRDTEEYKQKHLEYCNWSHQRTMRELEEKDRMIREWRDKQ